MQKTTRCSSHCYDKFFGFIDSPLCSQSRFIILFQEKKIPGGPGQDETVKNEAINDDKAENKPDDQALEHESANKKLRSRKTDPSSQAKDKQKKGPAKNDSDT